MLGTETQKGHFTLEEKFLYKYVYLIKVPLIKKLRTSIRDHSKAFRGMRQIQY